MTKPAVIKHHGDGHLFIGLPSQSKSRNRSGVLKQLVDFFAKARVSIQISENILEELWSKLMLNCIYNAISGISKMEYENSTNVNQSKTPNWL